MLKHFLPLIKNKNILVRSDSTTVVQYINKQSGTRSPPQCYRTWDLWNFAIKTTCISKQHTYWAAGTNWQPVIQNQDHAYRVDASQIGGSETFSFTGLPSDRPVCISSKQTISDFLFLDSSSGSSGFGCPIGFMGEHVRVCIPSHLSDPESPETYGEISLSGDSLAPKWPCRHWYTDLLQLSIACPRKLPLWPNLLHQPNTRISHPNPEVFNLHAWLVLTEISKKRAFQASLENSYQLHGERAHTKITPVNLTNSVAGVMKGKLIPILPL